jgi:hypothetical protein
MSKLPGDVVAEKKAAQAQQTIDAHMTKCKLSECVIPYSHQLFRRAAIEWLIKTDQVSSLVIELLNNLLTRIVGSMEAHTGSQISKIQRQPLHLLAIHCDHGE